MPLQKFGPTVTLTEIILEKDDKMKMRIEAIQQEMDRYYQGYRNGLITEMEYVELIRPLDHELDNLLMKSISKVLDISEEMRVAS
jgi:hypothetical protein